MANTADDAVGTDAFSRLYKITEFDNLLIKLGSWSRFQQIQWLLLFLAAVPQAWYTYAPAFAAAKPKPDQVFCVGNPGLEETEFCGAWQNGTCKEAGYNTPYTSIVTEWDILCDDAKKYVPLTKTIFYAGKLFGAYFFGWVSDRYGRRVTLLITMLIQFVASLIESFSVNFVMYVVLRVPLGICSGGCLIAGFLLMTEMATPQWRRWANCLSQVAYGVGIAVQALIAYFIRGWKPFSLVITLLNVPFIAYYWIIPESPRWLSARGRVKEAEKILRRMAKANGYEYPEGTLAAMQREGREEERKKTYHLWHLFSTKYLIKITLIEAWSWCVTSMVYYGLSFNSGNLAGDFYLNFAASGLVEIPAYLLATYLVENEHESEDDSEDEWSDFSDLSSGNDSSDMSGEESPSRGQKDVRRKKVPKARNKQGNESSKEKRKKSSGKYLSNDDVKRLEETLKSYVLSAQTHCENELRNEKSLSIFPVRKQMVSTLLNSDTIRVMFVKLCRDIYSKIIKAFTEISSAKVKNSDKRASFSVICSQLLLTVEESEVWRNMKKIIVTTIQLQENETDEVNFHAAVVLNTIYWALYENFHSAVMQIKIDSDKRKTQTNASEGADTVVDSDFVDVARVSGAALHKLRKGREKIVNGRKGARRVSEATKENYAAEVKIMSEMVCSAEEKTSLPLGLKRLDEGKLTFFNSKFTVVLLTLDKRIREMLTEKNLKRYPKNLMKLTKQSVALDEELQELFLAASKRACTAPFEEIRACSIWQELVKRICNTRFKEFYSAQEEKKLIQEGKVVSADQSLRDKLKTYSVDKRT